MKKISILFVLSLAIMLQANSTLSAQVHQILIGNGGSFGTPGNKIKVGGYDPSAKKYATFDSFAGNSVTEFLTEGNITYLATDAGIYKYDLDNNTRITNNTASGIRRMASYGQYIVATVNDYITTTRLKIFKKSDLSLVYKDSMLLANGTLTIGEGIAVIGDTAYIALEGNYPKYGDTGRIAVYDLKNKKQKRNITLDTATKGISNLYTDGKAVIGVTASNYSRVTVYTISTNTFQILTPSSTFDYSGGFGFYNNMLFAGFSDGIGTYNVSGKSYNKVIANAYMAGATYDTVNKEIYYTTASYSKAGKCYAINSIGKVTDSFMVGISPQAVAMDYHIVTGIENTNQTNIDFNLYPNPANNVLNISLGQGAKYKININDITGKNVLSVNEIQNNFSANITDLPMGMYIVTVQNENGVSVKKFVKE